MKRLIKSVNVRWSIDLACFARQHNNGGNGLSSGQFKMRETNVRAHSELDVCAVLSADGLPQVSTGLGASLRCGLTWCSRGRLSESSARHVGGHGAVMNTQRPGPNRPAQPITQHIRTPLGCLLGVAVAGGVCGNLNFVVVAFARLRLQSKAPVTTNASDRARGASSQTNPRLNFIETSQGHLSRPALWGVWPGPIEQH